MSWAMRAPGHGEVALIAVILLATTEGHPISEMAARALTPRILGEVYAPLLSTMIPSLQSRRHRGRFLKADGLPRGGAAVLTGEWRSVSSPGVAAQTPLAYGVIFYAVPAAGIGLLAVAHKQPMLLTRLLTGAS
jgi:hypothetical protein